MLPQRPQDGSNSLQQACCETFKDLFVHTTPKNGLVLIWNIQLQEWKKTERRKTLHKTAYLYLYLIKLIFASLH